MAGGVAPAQRGRMTPHERERYHRARSLGRVVRVKNVLCWDCARVAMLRLPENKHNVFDHTHMVIMKANALASAAMATTKRVVLERSKALAEALGVGAKLPGVSERDKGSE